MNTESTRRDFLRGGAVVTAGLAAAGTGEVLRGADEPAKPRPAHDHGAAGQPDYPRDRPGRGGPIGSATDRGKLVPGLRAAGLPPVPVVTPDLAKLPWKMVDGVKEFHLHAMHTRREFLPGAWMDVWGYNESVPGPTIEANQGDRVRIVLHNMLPEPTTLHLHGIELPNRFDGVPGVEQEPVPPGKTFVYEFDAHQEGTYIYHSHGPMQEGLGMAGLLILHPREAHHPPVDHDFALLIQEWAILPLSTVPNVTSMEFNWFTLNGRSAPYITALVVKLGSRVRIRLVNMSPIDHHPMHLHGHTFWVTGTEAGRIPESAWVPGNSVLVGVAQARDIEFIANNPGDWVLHCHMFHHMMNHMTVMVGPMGGHTRGGMPAGANAQSGMGMAQGGPALSSENGPSLGRAMGENTGNERAVRTGPQDMAQPGGHEGHEGHGDTMKGRVPGFPADMMDMMGMLTEAEMRRVNKPETRGMRRGWFAGVEALHTIVRVLPPELYDKVVSGKGEVEPGASVPGGGPGKVPGMKEGSHAGHEGHGGTEKPKESGKPGGEHEHKH
jgi:FtsP/CotA-like multicopper oxidase with cupredoxin domain